MAVLGRMATAGILMFYSKRVRLKQTHLRVTCDKTFDEKDFNVHVASRVASRCSACI